MTNTKSIVEDDELINVRDTDWYKATKASMTPGVTLRAHREREGLTQQASPSQKFPPFHRTLSDISGALTPFQGNKRGRPSGGTSAGTGRPLQILFKQLASECQQCGYHPKTRLDDILKKLFIIVRPCLGIKEDHDKARRLVLDCIRRDR